MTRWTNSTGSASPGRSRSVTNPIAGSHRRLVVHGGRIVAAALVGDLSRVGLITHADVDGLAAAGAVGDICAHWIDAQGRLVDHPLNSRVVALSPDKLKNIPCVVIASGGRTKSQALRGVLKGGMCDVVITDEVTAKAILAMDAK